MNETKSLDEIFCPECGKTVKRNAVICVHCGIQIKLLQNSVTKSEAISTTPKSRRVALWLVLFLGFFSWLYTFRKDWWKFLISCVIFFILLFVIRRNEAAAFIIGAIVYLWPVIDVTVRKESFYENYPYG
ncbi:MAG: zinc ribbon domain-containing protein [Cyanobacteria bacterium]|nr:zinc ribbon domain-containing protein [Cyanobacteriota bacterium]